MPPGTNTQRRPKKVLAFGTFDLLHPGHRSFLRQAKKLGHKLIVAVGRDHVVAKLKGHRPHQPERHRRKVVAELPYVHAAVLASKNPKHRFSFIKKHNPDVIALGYDQKHFAQNLRRDLQKRRIFSQVVRLKPHFPQRYKSSIIRRRVNQTTTT